MRNNASVTANIFSFLYVNQNPSRASTRNIAATIWFWNEKSVRVANGMVKAFSPTHTSYFQDRKLG